MPRNNTADKMEPTMGPTEGVGLKKYFSFSKSLEPLSSWSYGVEDSRTPPQHVACSLQKGSSRCLRPFSESSIWHQEHPMMPKHLSSCVCLEHSVSKQGGRAKSLGSDRWTLEYLVLCALAGHRGKVWTESLHCFKEHWQGHSQMLDQS